MERTILIQLAARKRVKREREREEREKNNSFFEKRERERRKNRIQDSEGSRTIAGTRSRMTREFPAPHPQRASAPGRFPRAYFWHKDPRWFARWEGRNWSCRGERAPDTHCPTSPTSAELAPRLDRGAADQRRDARDARARALKLGRLSLPLGQARVTLRRAGGREPSGAEPSRRAKEQNSPPFTPARSTSESPTSPTHRDAGGSA